MTNATDTRRDDRILAWAEALSEGRSFRVFDGTATLRDLTNVRPALRKELLEAAALADVKVTITKVGDEARVRLA